MLRHLLLPAPGSQFPVPDPLPPEPDLLLPVPGLQPPAPDLPLPSSLLLQPADFQVLADKLFSALPVLLSETARLTHFHHIGLFPAYMHPPLPDTAPVVPDTLSSPLHTVHVRQTTPLFSDPLLPVLHPALPLFPDKSYQTLSVSFSALFFPDSVFSIHQPVDFFHRLAFFRFLQSALFRLQAPFLRPESLFLHLPALFWLFPVLPSHHPIASVRLQALPTHLPVHFPPLIRLLPVPFLHPLIFHLLHHKRPDNGSRISLRQYLLFADKLPRLMYRKHLYKRSEYLLLLPLNILLYTLHNQNLQAIHILHLTLPLFQALYFLC